MPRKSLNVRQLVKKSQESAILATDIYNKPATKFRSHGYIVLMIIAWTSLFHAIFEKRKINYYYKIQDSRKYVKIDGERKSWEISKCCEEFFIDKNSPIKKNLEFFIAIRNKIEHRFLPSLDYEICGECQALLQNYEKILIQEFGEKYCLSDTFSIPLQLLTIKPEWKNSVLKELQGKQYHFIKTFIDGYRTSLEDSIWQSNEYCFRVFLVPKLGNNQRTSSFSIEFVQYDSSNPDEMKKYEKLVTMIKDRQVPVVNLGGLRAIDVCNLITAKLKIHFIASHEHVRCWKYFQVRPSSGNADPHKTKSEYCQYDATHKDYVYTTAWVDFLILELSNEAQRKKIFGISNPNESLTEKWFATPNDVVSD
jgi:hypothetical protein